MKTKIEYYVEYKYIQDCYSPALRKLGERLEAGNSKPFSSYDECLAFIEDFPTSGSQREFVFTINKVFVS